jgi:uncharacterized membrane protein YfcA
VSSVTEYCLSSRKTWPAFATESVFALAPIIALAPPRRINIAGLSDFDLGGLAAGLVGGLLSGMFGIGGGIVLVPLLGLLLGLKQLEAQGVTLAVLLLPVGLPAVLAYRKRISIRWWLVTALAVGFVASVGLGARAANAMSDRPLRVLFAIFVLAVAAQMWRVQSGSAPGIPPGTAASSSSLNGLWIGASGGFLAGLFGVGGGIVMVPLLVLAVRLDQHEAQATTLAAMLPPVGLPGVLAYAHSGGRLPWMLMGMVAGGFAAGALAGARIAVRTRTGRLTRAVALFLIAVAGGLAWTALRT